MEVVKCYDICKLFLNNLAKIINIGNEFVRGSLLLFLYFPMFEIFQSIKF
jgi:hypothetical protein